MEKCAFFKILIHISLRKRFNVTRNVTFRILKYIKNGGSVTESSTASCYIFSRITNPLAVINKYTRRIGAVVKVGIHTADDVVSEVILVILRHFSEFLMRPVSLIFQILVNLVVSRNNGYIGIGRVNFNDMKNLSTGTCCIVKYHFGLNSRTGNEHVILFGDYVVVTVSSKACAVENNIVLFPVGNSSKCSHRKHAHTHYNSND